jgi:voltage-gated potassium channel
MALIQFQRRKEIVISGSYLIKTFLLLQKTMRKAMIFTQNKKGLIYELFMSLLALIAVSFALVDITVGISPIISLFDNIILIIFIVDYLIRFILAKNKLLFFKSNILDLLAIIPFSSLFKVFRIVKLGRLTRLSRLGKIFKLSKLLTYIARFSKRFKIFLDTNGFKYSLLVTFIIVSVGAIAISQFENMKIADAFWWAFVTATTVGYGDISPATLPGRLTAVILMVTGIGLIGTLTSTITSYFLTKEQKKSPKIEVIHSIQKQIESIDDLTDQDIDEICLILKALKNK